MNTTFCLVVLDGVHSSYLLAVALGWGVAACALYVIGLIGQSLRVLGIVLRAGIWGLSDLGAPPGAGALASIPGSRLRVPRRGRGGRWTLAGP